MKYVSMLTIVVALSAMIGCDSNPQAEPSAATPEQAAVPSTTVATPSTPTAAKPEKIVKSDEQWKAELTPEQYRILRQAGTERAFTHPYHNSKSVGIYKCAGCDAELFRSNEKFNSGCGWPSFYDPATNTAIEERPDTSHGMVRTEVVCARCGGHLGHVFNDAPDQPTGLRYCINGAALVHVPAEDDAE